jgi:hypothetical protein
MKYVTEVMSPDEYHFRLDVKNQTWYEGVARKVPAVNTTFDFQRP